MGRWKGATFKEYIKQARKLRIKQVKSDETFNYVKTASGAFADIDDVRQAKVQQEYKITA